MANIDQSDAKRVLDTVCAWFDEGLKSSNKVYHPIDEREEDQTEEQDKHRDRQIRRNLDAQEAAKQNKLTYNATDGKTDLDAGKYIIENKIKAGNCIQMTQAALQFCMQDEAMSSKMQHAWRVDSGPHTFLVVSDGPQFENQDDLTVGSFNAQNTKGLFVIDPWIRFAGPAENYAQAVRDKTEKWYAKDKVISTGDVDEETVVDSKGDEFEIEIPLDYKTARKFRRELMVAPLTVTEAFRQQQQQSPVPQHREGSERLAHAREPSAKRARVSITGESTETRAGPSTSAQARDSDQRVHKTPHVASEEKPPSPSHKHGFGR